MRPGLDLRLRNPKLHLDSNLPHLVGRHAGLVGRDAGPVRGQAVPAVDVAQPERRAQAGHHRAQVVRPALRMGESVVSLVSKAHRHLLHDHPDLCS